MGVGVPKGETQLAATVDRILQGLEKDGTAPASTTAGSARRARRRCRAISSSAAPGERAAPGHPPAAAAALSRVDAGGLRHDAAGVGGVHRRRAGDRPAADGAACRRRPWLALPARALVAFLRKTPLLVQLFFWYFGAAQLLGEDVVGALSAWAAWRWAGGGCRRRRSNSSRRHSASRCMPGHFARKSCAPASAPCRTAS